MRTAYRRVLSAIGIMAAIVGAGCSGNERFANMKQENGAAVSLSSTGGQDRASGSVMAEQSCEHPSYRVTSSFSESRHVAIEIRHFLIYKDLRRKNGYNTPSSECAGIPDGSSRDPAGGT